MNRTYVIQPWRMIYELGSRIGTITRLMTDIIGLTKLRLIWVS